MDRYAYVNNNPLRYTDPSGNVLDPGDDEGDFINEYSLEKIIRTAEEISIPPGLLPQPAAKLYSIIGTVGAGPWFLIGGIDIVKTSNEIGIFTISGAGPNVGGSDLSGINQNISSEDAQFTTPQWGVSIYTGSIFGKDIQDEIERYGGTASNAGGSIGPISGDIFSSISEVYGIPDFNIWGYKTGLGFDLAPAEIHINYTNAVFHPILSEYITGFFR